MTCISSGEACVLIWRMAMAGTQVRASAHISDRKQRTAWGQSDFYNYPSVITTQESLRASFSEIPQHLRTSR